MTQDKIVNLASKSYHTATLNYIKLNLPDLKRIEKTMLEGYSQVALEELQRLIKLIERDFEKEKEKIEYYKKLQ